MDGHEIKVVSDGFVWLILSHKQAHELWRVNVFSLYVLHDDDSESLIETEDDFIAATSRGLDIGIGAGFLTKKNNVI